MEQEKLTGLTTQEAHEGQKIHGKNELTQEKPESFFKKILSILSEPMFILLMVAAVVYFILGEPRDGAIMLVFVVGIIAIDVIQEWKTDKTLAALKELSAPHITVIRDGSEMVIDSVDLVPDDIMIIHEGIKIPADGYVLKSNDLCVDESSLTGESQGVWKTNYDRFAVITDYWRDDYCYAGTLATQGSGYIKVAAIGSKTEYGKIGLNVVNAIEDPNPLKIQIDQLVKTCAIIAGILFVTVGLITFLNMANDSINERIIHGILAGVTLAMAMIPEEFPVILTVFLSMGAWRLAKKNSLIKKLAAVETLGSISVLCVDKTGTITMNQMKVAKTFTMNDGDGRMTRVMGLACETETYDPMEKAILEYCETHGFSKEDILKGELVSEYSFTNELKMMGHIWRLDDSLTLNAKGAYESIIPLCHLDSSQLEAIETAAMELSKEGLRVIAVGSCTIDDVTSIPESILQCHLEFEGLIGLMDPPRENVEADIESCKRAGIKVVMITGDNGATASSIAKKIGMDNADEIITGAMIDQMDDNQMKEAIKTGSIFSRVIPEHKMRIVKAFKENGEIVAMTGDGVNDAPALKFADIGIAMGKRGSDVSREAADLILMDDNFSTIVETIRDGRRLYDNIRKAIGYVFVIHIPIALASLLAPLLNIPSQSLFLLPLHVVLLELIIDPTCSIVLERQPAESDLMVRPPRNPKEQLLTGAILVKSTIQGLAIFATSFGIYYYMLEIAQAGASVARSMGLATIMIANIFLVQVNSSNHDYALSSMKKLARDKVMWLATGLTIAGVIIAIYSPLNDFVSLAPLSLMEMLAVVALAAVSVIWYEFVKFFKKMK